MILPSDITKPCKHGFIIDLTDGERRVQVRVFEFETQQIAPEVRCEMPVSIDEGQAIARLRQAMECLRESVIEEAGRSARGPVTLGDIECCEKEGGIAP
jgi:hypothetical protein